MRKSSCLKNNLKIIYFFSLLTCFVGNRVFCQIEFIENKGQWDPRVKYMTEAGNGVFYLEKNGFTVVQHDQNDLNRLHAKRHGMNLMEQKSPENVKVHSNAYTVRFIDANPNPAIIPDKVEPGISNYFIGNDPKKWATNCKTFLAVTYKDIYPGVDVRYYSDAAGRLKYDLEVKPGADISKIALKYDGVEKIQVKNKELVIATSVGENRELNPYSYQVVDNVRTDVDASYHVKGNIVKFNIKDFSSDHTLIIDPTEKFFSYTGSTADNWGFTATYGPDGSFFSGAIVWTNGYPVSTGAFQDSFLGGDFDIGIMKLSPDGRTRLYATYIGGSGKEQPHSLIVDPQGNLILAGRSNSNNYPTTQPLIGGDTNHLNYDIVITKLNATGSKLIGSIKIGGAGDDGMNIKDLDKGTPGPVSLNRNYGDDARSEVILDGANNIYVASCTQSTGSGNGGFPTTPGAFQRTSMGGQDAVVIKLDPTANTVLFSTLLGGKDDDAAYVLSLGSTNNIYVAGGTRSIDLKGISPSGVLSSTNSGGDCDGFIIELSNDGSNVIRGTYLGTSSADQIYGIQTDKKGDIYVMGTTEGSWPVLNAPFSQGNGKQFISKIKPDLSTFIYSTVFGSGSTYPNISPTAFLVDRCENVYVSGWGGKSNIGTGYKSGTTIGLSLVNNILKSKTDQTGSDFYFFVLEKDALSQLYGDVFGQEDPAGSNPLTFGDHVDGGTSRFDKNGVIYQAMCANCNKTINFRGTPGAWSPDNKAQTGAMCSLGMLKVALNFAGVAAAPKAAIAGSASDTSGCIPLTVNFTDTLPTKPGKNYIWDFGDGSPQVKTSNQNISHTYNNVGRYLVMLTAVDSSTCNISDTAYLHIKAGDNIAIIDFKSNKLPPCNNLTYRFDNISVATRGPFKPGSFTWDFGDQSAVITAGTESVTHNYQGPGTYKVKLTLMDTSFCNSPADTIKLVRLSPTLKASFITPARGCQPYTAIFNNTSSGGLNFIWDFGDGTTSTVDNPTHLYPNIGTYTVKLYAFDSTSCNKTDSFSFVITVSPVPTSNFSFSPVPPQENTFTDFTNLSQNAIKYFWDFGDGDTSIEVNPHHIFPSTGVFQVCLKATNDAGCSADTCFPVSALIKPLLDVPKAFTPGKGNINSTIFVRGFGIKKMNWTIYNRWGQAIFQSGTPKIGWDGTFKGKIQPLDVYTYTLDVVFSDGKALRKTGDITLLR